MSDSRQRSAAPEAVMPKVDWPCTAAVFRHTCNGTCASEHTLCQTCHRLFRKWISLILYKTHTDASNFFVVRLLRNRQFKKKEVLIQTNWWVLGARRFVRRRLCVCYHLFIFKQQSLSTCCFARELFTIFEVLVLSRGVSNTPHGHSGGYQKLFRLKEMFTVFPTLRKSENSIPPVAW